MTIEYIINGVVMCLIMLVFVCICIYWMFRGPE